MSEEKKKNTSQISTENFRKKKKCCFSYQIALQLPGRNFLCSWVFTQSIFL